MSAQAPAGHRVAIVTGSAQGIGRAIALRLAANGYDVAVNDLPTRLADLEEIVREVKGHGARGLAVVGDVTVEAEVEKLVTKTAQELGRVDVMVANAGIGHVSLIVDMDPAAFDRVYALNVRAVALCYKHAARQMIKQGWGGRLIGASSGAGKLGVPGLSAYSSSKFAIRGLSQSVAMELRRYKITVNTYAPGLIDTPGIGRNAASMMDSGTMTRPKGPGMKTAMDSSVVSSIVAYLASEEAHHITGQSISVDGGHVML
ncbi:NAD(P)-binding protein [Peniophora sp. CONT]|nr:NAD(P)-binding protein [Peniophora sp. CONT]